MKKTMIILLVLITFHTSFKAQDLRGEVLSYETVINRVHLVKGNRGILNLVSDTVVDGAVESLTAVLLDKDGNRVRTETYTSRMIGGGVRGTFFSLTSDTVKRIDGRIDTETGSMIFWGNDLETETLHFERRGFDYETPWDELANWTDYTYRNGRLIQESTMSNSMIAQSTAVNYEYNTDGTIKSRVFENKTTGRKERMDYYCHNGRIDSMEISYFNYSGNEIGPDYNPTVKGNLNNTLMFASGAATASDFRRAKQYYTYSADGSYQIIHKNDGTDKTEYYNKEGRLLKTVLPDGTVYNNRYNNNGDPLLESKVFKDRIETTKYDLYKYDNHGNWTRRLVYISDEDGFLIPDHVEYRRFCYRNGERYNSSAFRDVKLKPWYVHVVVSDDSNSNSDIFVQDFSLGEEMKDVNESFLNQLKMLPGFEVDANGNYTLEGHPLIITKVVAE